MNLHVYKDLYEYALCNNLIQILKLLVLFPQYFFNMVINTVVRLCLYPLRSDIDVENLLTNIYNRFFSLRFYKN